MKLDQILFLLLFGAFVAGLWYFANWGVDKWSWYFTIPVIAFFFLVAWLIDRRKKRNSEEP